MRGKETTGCTWQQGVFNEEESEEGPGWDQIKIIQKKKEKRNMGRPWDMKQISSFHRWPAVSSELPWNSVARGVIAVR
jgi:hypothetical protein